MRYNLFSLADETAFASENRDRLGEAVDFIFAVRRRVLTPSSGLTPSQAPRGRGLLVLQSAKGMSDNS